jgi:hypothetical protein
MVQIADTICLRLNIGLAHPDFLPDLNAEGLRLLSIKLDEVDDLTQLYRNILSTSLVSTDSLTPAISH